MQERRLAERRKRQREDEAAIFAAKLRHQKAQEAVKIILHDRRQMERRAALRTHYDNARIAAWLERFELAKRSLQNADL